MSLLPVILAELLLFASLAGRGVPIRAAFLTASCVWGVLVVLVSEAASFVCALTPAVVVAFWCVVCAGLLLGLDVRRAARSFGDASRGLRSRVSGCEVTLGIALVAVVGVVLLVALSSAPNTWDSHTYHLARVRHWMQNRSIAFFPTNVERQIDAGPWAELAVLQLDLATGGDRFAACVQWFALVGTAVATSLIARGLGASVVGQTVASVATVTLPMAILQGSSTQNDLVVSFWLSASVALALLAAQPRERSAWLIVPAGGCLGLAVLTKGTAYAFAAPFVLWLGVRFGRVHGFASRWLLVSALLALSVNVPHYARNLRASGSPLGPGFVMWDGRPVSYANDRVSIGGTISNTLRSAALQLAAPDLHHTFGAAGASRATPATASASSLPAPRQWNEWLVGATSALVRSLGQDPDDRATTWNQRRFHVPAAGWNFEDTAGNPLHVVLFAAAIPILLLVAARRGRWDAVVVAGCCVCGVVLFNALFAWQVYHSRLHLLAFTLFCAPFGVAVSRLGRRWASGVAMIMVAASVPWLVDNLTRPLVGERSVLRVPRFEQYFAQYPHLHGPFVAAAQELARARCSDVVLHVANDAWEYPLWVALDHVGWHARIRHGGIANYTAHLAAPCRAVEPRTPCAEVDVTMAGVRTQLLAREAAP